MTKTTRVKRFERRVRRPLIGWGALAKVWAWFKQLTGGGGRHEVEAYSV